MRFHAQYCNNCKSKTLFVEKLINPSDCNCTEIEDICQQCNYSFTVEPKKQKLKIKF